MIYIGKLMRILHWVAFFILVGPHILGNKINNLKLYLLFILALILFNTYNYYKNNDYFHSKEYRSSFIYGPGIVFIALLIGMTIGKLRV